MSPVVGNLLFESMEGISGTVTGIFKKLANPWKE